MKKKKIWDYISFLGIATCTIFTFYNVIINKMTNALLWFAILILYLLDAINEMRKDDG